MREKSKDAIRLGVIAHAIDELASGDARDTLVRLVGSMSGTQEALQQATSILHVMTGLYDQASTILSSQIGDVPGLRP